jgi:hypothetical protein
MLLVWNQSRNRDMPPIDDSHIRIFEGISGLISGVRAGTETRPYDVLSKCDWPARGPATTRVRVSLARSYELMYHKHRFTVAARSGNVLKC